MLIDTNIIIYAINTRSPKNKPAQQFLEKNLNELDFAHQNILEAIRVLTHSKFSSPMKREDAILAVSLILESGNLITPTNSSLYLAFELIKKYERSGNRIFDAYLAATALSNSIDTIATDNTKDFQFTGLKVINPFI